MPTTSNNTESDNKTVTDANLVEKETTTEDINVDKSNIWKEKPMDDVEKTREKEFEEYLADLFV